MILFYGGFMGILWQTLLLYIHLDRNHGIVFYIFLYPKERFQLILPSIQHSEIIWNLV